jgi:8-oxo-dGTP diphosphatase
MRNIVDALFAHDGMVLLARRSLRRAAYPGLWSFPGGHAEQNETLTEALVREIREEVGVTPTSFVFVVSLADPNASEVDPVTYHMYSIREWEGGEPALLGDEHSELRWLTVEAAIALPDLTLEEYRALLRNMMSHWPVHQLCLGFTRIPEPARWAGPGK